LIPSNGHTARIQQHREQATRLANFLLLLRAGQREKIPQEDGTNHQDDANRPVSEPCQSLPHMVIEPRPRHHDVPHSPAILDPTLCKRLDDSASTSAPGTEP